MEIIGTNFTLSLGAWRLRFLLAIEDRDEPAKEPLRPPHRLVHGPARLRNLRQHRYRKIHLLHRYRPT